MSITAKKHGTKNKLTISRLAFAFEPRKSQ